MDFSKIVVHTVFSSPFAENSYLVHLLGQKSCFAVDPGLEPENILDCLRKNDLELISILATHGHADHIGGIGVLKQVYPNATIHIGEADKEMLIDPNQNLSVNLGVPLVFPEADFTLLGGETLEIAGIPLEVLPVPGHTRGHVAYLIPTEPRAILFIGDVIIQKSIGRTDFPGGSHAILMNSIRTKVLSLPDDTVLYAGHGEVSTIGEEKRTNPFLDL